MAYPKGTVTLTGYIDVPSDRLTSVQVGLVDHIELTRAEAGCLFFEVTANSEVAGRFDVSEAFVDQAAFDHHQHRAKNSPWAEITKDIPRSYEIKTL